MHCDAAHAGLHAAVRVVQDARFLRLTLPNEEISAMTKLLPEQVRRNVT
jgi:hypothetical protein